MKKTWFLVAALSLFFGFRANAMEMQEPSQAALEEAKGTVVHVGKNEVLLVKRLDVPCEELEKSYDDWLSPETINDVFRLSNVGEDLKVGDQIRFKYAIMTNSIPPLVPVHSYEIIK